MINAFIPETDKQTFNHERRDHPHPRVRQTMEVVWLKSKRVCHRQTGRWTDIGSTTVTQYWKTCQAHGLDALKTLNFRRPKSERKSFRETLKVHFEENPAASVKQALCAIEALTGIERSENRGRLLLETVGMKGREIGMIPAKADVEQQEPFKKTREVRLEEAKIQQRAVLFVDAAHFVFTAFPGNMGCLARRFIRAASRRQRFNVPGALNAIAHELVAVSNNT